MAEAMIISDPSICMGKPVVRGTRITVELILENLGAGMTLETLLQEYPQLSREAVLAALAYAAKALSSEETHPIGDSAA